jgi:hypothetical protein
MAAGEGRPAIPSAFAHVPGPDEVLAEVAGRLGRELTGPERAVFRAAVELLVVPMVQQWADLGSFVEQARHDIVTEFQRWLRDEDL